MVLTAHFPRVTIGCDFDKKVVEHPDNQDDSKLIDFNDLFSFPHPNKENGAGRYRVEKLDAACSGFSALSVITRTGQTLGWIC